MLALYYIVLILIICFAGVLLFGAPYLPTLSKQRRSALELLELKKGETPDSAAATFNIATPLRPAACRIAGSSQIIGDDEDRAGNRFGGQELRRERNR